MNPTAEPIPSEGAERRARWLLAALLVASVVPRLWLLSTLPPAPWEDERINLANVRAILETGRLEPVNFWYGRFSYLPHLLPLGISQALHRATGVDAFAVLADGRLTPLAFLLCRLLQLLFGVLSIGVAYAVGRRVFAPEVGLAGAFLLAATPRHLHASTVFKPDVLLLLTTLLALHWTLGAVTRPTHRRFLLAGAGVGLTTATKLNGATAVVPLLVAGALATFRVPRRWLHTALAGAAAAAVFLVVNPQLSEDLSTLAENREHYQELATGTRAEVLVETLGYPFDPTFHGAAIAAIATGGLLLLVAALAVPPFGGGYLPGVRRELWLVFLSYPVAYYAIYVAVTERAKPNHFLQVLPMTSLLAGFLLVAGWRWLSRWLPATRRDAVAAALFAVLAGWWGYVSFEHVYRQAVPPTWVVAARLIQGELPPPLQGRLVVHEPEFSPLLPGGQILGTASLLADRLPDLPAADLDLADAELFPHRRLAEEGSGPYLQRIARLPANRSRIVRPRWLRARGPALVVLLHPRQLRGDLEGRIFSLPIDDRGTAAGKLPGPPAAGELVSLWLRLPVWRPALAAASPRLEVGGRELPLAPIHVGRERALFLTPRFRLATGGERVELSLADVAGLQAGSATFRLYRWRDPRPRVEAENGS